MTPEETRRAWETVRPFINGEQYAVLERAASGEEGEYFRAVVNGLAKTIESIPKTYEQDGVGDDSIVHLHYFRGESDWYITENDIKDGSTTGFGFAVLNGDFVSAEFGYISVSELTALGAELDLHFVKTSLKNVKHESGAKSGVAGGEHGK
jgi:hypothetical protein